MKSYLGYKVGDVVGNRIGERYTITAITTQHGGKHFSLKGVNVNRSICIHEWVMKNYPLANDKAVEHLRAPDEVTQCPQCGENEFYGGRCHVVGCGVPLRR